jgi:hypothetical protein
VVKILSPPPIPLHPFKASMNKYIYMASMLHKNELKCLEYKVHGLLAEAKKKIDLHASFRELHVAAV